MDNITIGEKEYSREELLFFGKSQYPKFYWIKRGIGIFLMFVGFLSATALVATAVGLQLGLSNYDGKGIPGKFKKHKFSVNENTEIIIPLKKI